MKQYTAKKTSYLMRWAFLWDKMPDQTSLCSIFWRTVLFTPLKLVAVIAGLFAIAIYHNYQDVLAVLCGGVVIFLAALYGEHRRKKAHIKPPTQRKRLRDTMLVQGAIAIKNRYCPIVFLE